MVSQLDIVSAVYNCSRYGLVKTLTLFVGAKGPVQFTGQYTCTGKRGRDNPLVVL